MKRMCLLAVSMLTVFSLVSCSKDTVIHKNIPGESSNTIDTLKLETLEQKRDERLYPAYTKEKGVKKWGLINKEGKFIIEPQYEIIYDFQDNGLAQMTKGEKSGIIDEYGKVIVEPQYDSITKFSEGLAVLNKAEENYIVTDEKGIEKFQFKDSIGEFHDGLSVLGRKTDKNSFLYGYTNKDGKVIVEPIFLEASEFKNGKALVKIKDGKYEIIDVTGKILTELDYKLVTYLSEDMMMYVGSKDLRGYLKSNGHKLTEAKFSLALPFEDGFAIVNDSKDFFEPKQGVIDRNGKFVIKPEFAGIEYVGEGLFAVSNKAIYGIYDNVTKKALIDKHGKKITDYKYYDIGRFKNGLTYVSEDTLTYFINKKGEKIADLPELNGAGTMKLADEFTEANIDRELIYLTRDGKIVWQQDKTQKLKNGAIVKALKYRPDRGILIYYPEISNLVDEKIEKRINDELKKKFIGSNQVSQKDGDVYTENIDIDFSIDENKDLLIVEKDGYFYPIGADHGQPSRENIHINMKTGEFYTLPDLFKKNKDYQTSLKNIINRHLKDTSNEKSLLIFEPNIDGVRPDQEFIITQNSLRVIFPPGEISAFAAGFLEFDISYKEIIDILDTDSGFYKSFDKVI